MDKQEATICGGTLSENIKKGDEERAAYQYQIHHLVDAKDTAHNWLVGYILALGNDKTTVSITFDGWIPKWNEVTSLSATLQHQTHRTISTILTGIHWTKEII